MCCGGTKAPTCAKNCSIVTFVGGGITLLGMLIAVGVFNVRSPDTPPNINGVTLPCPISVLSVQGMFHENVTCYTDLHDDCDRRRLDTITTMNATQHLELQKKKLEGLKQIRLRLADPLAAVRHGAVELLKKTRLPAAKGAAAADKEAAPRRLSESCKSTDATAWQAQPRPQPRWLLLVLRRLTVRAGRAVQGDVPGRPQRAATSPTLPS